MWKKKEYVFLIVQQRILNTDKERALKDQVFEWVKKEAKSFWHDRKIEYIDYYYDHEKLDSKIFTYMMTFEPTEINGPYPIVFELYAYMKSNDERAFKDYEVEKKIFADEEQELIVFKIKI